jgi:two-component system osmolarity sensor histidine kinase EnvZ
MTAAADRTLSSNSIEGLESRRRSRFGINLFWRTFVLLMLLLAGCTVAWLYTFRALALEYEPRTLHMARQVASFVNLARTALEHSQAATRITLIRTLADQEGVRILPGNPGDQYDHFTSDTLGTQVTEELVVRLGEGTAVASRVNGQSGIWFGFVADNSAYWVLVDPERFSRIDQRTWLTWLAITMTLSLAGAALITRLINQPLKQLSQATHQVREGNYEALRLDEEVRTKEIRDVNISFNRMADQLVKIEQDRALMLAGISHDLRTPLARLRLETEMSVSDQGARKNMSEDIGQLDAILNKFLDYARSDDVTLKPVRLHDVLDACVHAAHAHADIRITIDAPSDLRVMADSIELQRVFANLIENSRRYGKTPSSGVAEIMILARANDDMVDIEVRDHGDGVHPELLTRLRKPFVRGDVARTSAVGTGLGLAIVTQTIERMSGTFEMTSALGRGLVVYIRLLRA